MTVRLGENGIEWSADNTKMSNKRSIFPQDTVWIFFQSSTPLGWSRSFATNDSTLRVVSSEFNGGNNGGLYPFTSIFTNSNRTFNLNTSNYTAGNTSLSVSQIPTHTHTFTGQYFTDQPAVNPQGQYINGNIARGSGAGTASGGATGNTGGGGAHSHDISVGNSFPVSVSLSVQYIDVFFASFNG